MFILENFHSTATADGTVAYLLLTEFVKACVFSSPEHKVLMVSYCDRALSVVVRRASSVVRKLFY